MTGPEAGAGPGAGNGPGADIDPAGVSRLAVPLLGFIGGLQMLDPSIASVALVSASKGLEFPPAVTALAASISTLALAATVMTAGDIADRVGRRTVLVAGLAIVVAGDLLVAAAPVTPVFLAGRAIAGVGFAAAFSAAYAAVRQVVERDRLGTSLGIFGAMSALTLLVLSPIGGLLTSLEWRAAFLLVPALSLVAMVAILRVVPTLAKVPGAKPDVAGQVLIAVGVTGLLYGLSRATPSVSDPWCWGPIAVGVASFVAFGVVEKRSSHPVFPMKILASRIFIAAVIVGIAWNLSQAVSQLQVSNLWQYLYRYSPGEVSVRFLPAVIAGIGAAVVVGRLLSSGLSIRVCAIGCFVMAATFAGLGFAGRESSYLWFLPLLLLLGVGMQLASVAQAQMFVTEAPPDYYGSVVSSRTTVGQWGYALGLSGSSVLMGALTKGGIAHRLIEAGVPPSDTGQGLDAVGLWVRVGTEPSTELGRTALANAAPSYIDAFSTTMWVFAALVLVVGVAAFFLVPGRRGRRADPEEADPATASNDAA